MATNTMLTVPGWLTYQQAGERLGCSWNTARMRFLRAGMEVRHVGNTPLVREMDLVKVYGGDVHRQERAA